MDAVCDELDHSMLFVHGNVSKTSLMWDLVRLWELLDGRLDWRKTKNTPVAAHPGFRVREGAVIGRELITEDWNTAVWR